MLEKNIPKQIFPSDFQVKEDLYKCYPNAKLGHLKTGGNFPFLSRSDEFNLFITVSCFPFEIIRIVKIFEQFYSFHFTHQFCQDYKN